MSKIRIRVERDFRDLLDVTLDADESVAQKAVADITSLLALSMNTQEETLRVVEGENL